ncbi:MAG: hypothetical protein QXM43_04680 [Desulfurococcaceae archaeon]
MGTIYSPPERMSPEAKSHSIYVSKDERLLVRIYNWQQALGYSILIRYYDRNGVERYIRRDGATREEYYVTNIYIELEEGYLTGVNVYSIYYPGASFWPFFALVALTHGRTLIEEVSTTLAYGVAGFSTPLSWPIASAIPLEDYVDAYMLEFGDIAATTWSWSPPGESEVHYLYLTVVLGTGTGTRLLTVGTSYGDYYTSGATVPLDVAGATYHVIVSHHIEPGIMGRTVYVNLPPLNHLRYGENIEVVMSGTLTGDRIDKYAMRWIRLPWIRR